jgi:xylulokinase
MLGLDGAGSAETIRVVGGGTRNRLALTIKANIFQRPIVVVDEAEVSALGAALLGGLAAGVFPDMEAALAQLDRREHIVEPDAAAERYAALRTMVFEKVHARLAPINRDLGAFRRMAGQGAG